MRHIGWIRVYKKDFLTMFPYMKGCLWDIKENNEYNRVWNFLIESDLFPPIEEGKEIPQYYLEVIVDKVDNKILEVIPCE